MTIAVIILGSLLIIGGFLGLIISVFMFGDIGIAAAIGSLSGLFAGIGIVLIGIKIRSLENKIK